MKCKDKLLLRLSKLQILMQVEPKPYDYLFKMLLIGDSGVGKTCLMHRYMDGHFHNGYLCSIGIDFKIKTIDIDGKKTKIQLWDTAGSERFRSITAAYYRGAAVFFFLFDVTNRSSMERVNFWHEESMKHGGDTSIRILVGSKCDLFEQRQVTPDEAQQFASSLSMMYIETSSKQNIGIDELFNLVCTQAIQIADEKSLREPKDSKNNLIKQKPEKKIWCC